MTRIIKLVRNVLISVFVVFAGVQTAYAATFSLSPSSGTFTVGDTITVNIMLNTVGAPIDGVDIRYLNYNPTLFQLLDENTGVSGIQILSGSLMPNTVANSADTTLGRISFSQVTSGGSTFSNAANQILAAARFKVLSAGTGAVTFDFTLGSTIDANVSSSGSDVLTAVTNGSYTLNQAFNFSLSNSGNLTVVQGNSVSNTITATLTAGIAQLVSFSASGFPAGVTYIYNPPSCAPTCSTIKTITTSVSTPPGIYPITASATGAGLTRTTNFSLTVNPTPSTKFTIGSRVKVSEGPLNVRVTPGTTGIVLGTQPAGAFGTVTGGPTFANNLWWWNINYDQAPDGWSTEDFLVLAVNQTPTVNAGTDQTITLPSSANLDGTVTDDGLPSSTLTTTWSKVSGPGSVTFGNGSSIDTTASFSLAGSYILRLTASDGVLSASDEVSVIVNPVPDTTPPIISNGQPTGTLPAGTVSATLSVATNENATCRYSTTAGTAFAAMTNTFSTTDGTTHISAVSGLQNGQTYTYYVRCQDDALNTNLTDSIITFNILTPAPDFSLSAETTNLSVVRGQTVSVVLTATITSGSPGAVAFSIASLPSGTTGVFLPTSCIPTCSSTLTISTSPTTPQGTSMVTVTAMSGGVTRSITINLTINFPALINLSFAPSLDALSSLSSLATKTFAVDFINPALSNTVASFTAKPDASTGKFTLPPIAGLTEGTYHIRYDTAGYLSRLQTNVAITNGLTITTPQLFSGDLNDDNLINSIDWSVMNTNWFTADPVADINLDTLVNSIDFSFLNTNWGKNGE